MKKFFGLIMSGFKWLWKHAILVSIIVFVLIMVYHCGYTHGVDYGYESGYSIGMEAGNTSFTHNYNTLENIKRIVDHELELMDGIKHPDQ